MTQIALENPSIRAVRRWLPWIAAAVVSVIALLIWWAVAFRTSSVGVGPAPQYFRVAPMDLEVKLMKDGELQAINNIEIVCEVEGSTTIQEIVKEGANVKAGDVLVVLDSSLIRQKIEDTTIELQKAEADVTNARELRDIQESKNATDLEAAEVALTLAQLDLRDYEEAAYPQLLSNAKTDLEMAKIDLKNRNEDLAQRRSLFGKGFVNATEVKKAELEVTKADNAVTKADTALKRLEEYTHAADLAAKRNALSQAEQKIARVKRENASMMSQRIADVNARESNLSIIRRRMERFQQQLDACTIHAPTDGMVVYATSNDRNAQNLIQEGTSVRERQAILRLPDTASMKVVMRVQEAQVPKLTEGQRAIAQIIGMPRPIGATITKISVLADSGNRWFNPDSKEYPVELVLDYTPSGLKPGMRADVEVLINRTSQALSVPLTSIYSVGNKTFVFTRGDEPRPAEVSLGIASDTHAQVLKGLSGGEEVLILERGQGQQLLARAGIKVEPTTRPSGAFDRPDGAPNGPPNADRPRRNRGDGQTPQQRLEAPGNSPLEGERPAGERPRRNRERTDGAPREGSPPGAPGNATGGRDNRSPQPPAAGGGK